jgi:CheY-like chemotaxis protein
MMPMPRKLLLADDSVTIQRVIELTFADEDVQVIAVGNGKDAIDRIQRDPPDIVLADAGMPERNGYEVAAFVKGQPAYAHIPVVLLTGAFEPVDEARAKSVGCDGILVKPFEPQIVIARVRDLLEGRQPSGMWSSPSVSQQTPPRQPAAAPLVAEPARRRPTATGDSLEAYFDQLDAAFSASGGSEAPSSPGLGGREAAPFARRPEPANHDPLGGWDPDLSGDPARPAAAEPPIAFPQRAAAPDPRPASPGPVAMPPAQAQPLSPSPVSPSPAAPLAPGTPSAPAAAPAAPAPAPAVTQAPPPASPPTLVEAFAALLAAEQRIGLTPSAATVPASSTAAPQGPPSDELVEAVSRRVLASLSEQSRPSVLEVAERLVRQEIERIKQSGQL